jgi:Ulp1 family protease
MPDDVLKQVFNQVRKWTRETNIFERKRLFIPMNSSAHWSLIIVCNPGNIIMTSSICDETTVIDEKDKEISAFVVCVHSLKEICKILRKYLEEIRMEK